MGTSELMLVGNPSIPSKGICSIGRLAWVDKGPKYVY